MNVNINNKNLFSQSLLIRLGCQKPILIFDFACTLKI